ncbi:RRNAD1-like [Schistosoma japonicum]|nr:RRNAD1-like [Schistosoma japonicum]
MSSNALNELIHDVLMFILEYNWIYNFQWIGDLFKIEGNSPNVRMSSVLDKLPTSWKDVLQTASLQELQMFVAGTSNSSQWPNDLLHFSLKCRQMTRLLSQYIIFASNNYHHHHQQQQLIPGCYFNPRSMCTDLIECIQASQIERNYLLKMPKKKSYELKQLSTLIQTILLSIVNNNNKNQNGDSVNLSHDAFNFKELDVNNKHIGDNFQTVPLISKESLQNNGVKDPNYKFPLTIVDIGSGLGYLSNYIAYSFIKMYGDDSFTKPKIISIECNESLHLKALTNLTHFDSVFQVKSLNSMVERLLFRVESSNLDLLQTKLSHLIADRNYLLLGLHCCGDLSQSMIELFHKDCSAQIILLVGCCYHKMTLDRFPMSVYLRKNMLNCDIAFIEKCISTATLRLACQHSPLTWLNWTEVDANKHRIRLLARIILDMILIKCDYLSSTVGQQQQRQQHILCKRFDPIQHCVTIKNLLTTSDIHFDNIYPHIITFWEEHLSDIVDCSRPISKDLFFTDYRDYFEHIWNLIPGLLALQQLFQPLLETLILFDRLWCLREQININGESAEEYSYQYSGYIRIFDPKISPRCMALLVCKKLNV